ncbi:17023_t:CDS:2, partial [Funneliformis geosporum]
MRKNKDFNHLTETEIIERLDHKNYEGGNIGLPKNSTLEERTKYRICKTILTYQLKNKLPLEQVAKKLVISEEELYNICRGKINDFSLIRLVNYLEKLVPDYELIVINNREQLNQPNHDLDFSNKNRLWTTISQIWLEKEIKGLLPPKASRENILLTSHPGLQRAAKKLKII